MGVSRPSAQLKTGRTRQPVNARPGERTVRPQMRLGNGYELPDERRGPVVATRMAAAPIRLQPDMMRVFAGSEHMVIAGDQRATVGEAPAPGDRLHAAARIHDLLRKTKILHGRGGTVLHEHRVGGNMAAFRQVPPHRFGFGHHFIVPLSAGGDEHARLALLLPQWPPPAAPPTTPTSCRNSFRPSPPVIVFSTMR